MVAIRAALRCQWIIDHMEQPPMHIDDLLSEVQNDHPIKDTMARRIALEKEQTEKDTVKCSDIIQNDIQQKNR